MKFYVKDSRQQNDVSEDADMAFETLDSAIDASDQIIRSRDLPDDALFIEDAFGNQWHCIPDDAQGAGSGMMLKPTRSSLEAIKRLLSPSKGVQQDIRVCCRFDTDASVANVVANGCDLTKSAEEGFWGYNGVEVLKDGAWRYAGQFEAVADQAFKK